MHSEVWLLVEGAISRVSANGLIHSVAVIMETTASLSGLSQRLARIPLVRTPLAYLESTGWLRALP